MRPGWIKLYGKMLDSDIWLIDQPFSFRDAFIHVLLSANWTDGVTYKNGHTVTIQRGQLLTSIRKLGAVFHWDKHKVYQWLKYMNACGMITSESIGFGTVLTVEKYDFYQSGTDIPAHTPTHEVAHENAHTPTHEVTPRYKNKEIRKENEDSKSPADAGTPPADTNEPPMGTPEWYALHYDD